MAHHQPSVKKKCHIHSHNNVVFDWAKKKYMATTKWSGDKVGDHRVKKTKEKEEHESFGFDWKTHLFVCHWIS